MKAYVIKPETGEAVRDATLEGSLGKVFDRIAKAVGDGTKCLIQPVDTNWGTIWVDEEGIPRQRMINQAYLNDGGPFVGTIVLRVKDGYELILSRLGVYHVIKPKKHRKGTHAWLFAHEHARALIMYMVSTWGPFEKNGANEGRTHEAKRIDYINCVCEGRMPISAGIGVEQLARDTNINVLENIIDVIHYARR